MVRILLSNLGGTENIGIVMMIRALVSNIEAEFFVHQLTVCRDYQKYGIQYTWKPFGFDVALDLGGDTFTLYYGVPQFLRHCFHLMIHVIFRQKFCLFAQTFSKYGKLRNVALFFMKRASLITVRELKSHEQLNSMGIKSYLTSDIAFLLDSWDSERYYGGSYHKIIAAKLSGNLGAWDGSRSENFKFSIFRKRLDMNMMKKEAGKNIDLLQRIFSD